MSRLSLAFALMACAGPGGCGWLGVGSSEEEARVRAGAGRICGPDVAALPCGSGVDPGVGYRYKLLTHCGIEYAYFDGRFWLADPKLDDGSGNPPAGWDNPFAEGVMTLLPGDEARFTDDEERTVVFRPAPDSYQPPGCA